MKIGVFLKQVPDTSSKIKIKPDGSAYEPEGLKYVVNPYDEFAIEEAIQVKEKTGKGEVVLVSLGPARVVESIRTGLAMGADRGIHIDDSGLTLDSFAVAKVLTEAARKENFDLIFCGKKGVDNDASQVIQIAAQMMNIPHVTSVHKFEMNEAKTAALATRSVGGGTQDVYDVSLPCIIGAEKGLNTPRYASLPGIMKAKSKAIENLKASDLLGDEGQKTEFINWRLPEQRKSGQIIDGASVEEKVQKLVQLLHDEAKVL